MPGIFISYRRADAGYVARQISDELKKRFGEESVFIDITVIEWAAEFPKVIAEKLEQADILLAIIGNRWLDARFSDGPLAGQRRLDDPHDFVRREIARALEREIPVLPVVIEGVSLSALARDLPLDLANLASRNEIPFRSGHDLEADLKRLVQAVRSLLLPPLTAEQLALPPGARVVPQGLRSYGQNEKAFFSCLLPDANANGALPKQLAFWKTRIEELNAAESFRVGLIYGPSGCGKSSLVKAGLLPNLAPHVTRVYIEARATETEAELLAAFHKSCPFLPRETSLSQALAAKDYIPDGSKVLIVLDQFEQYLHAADDDEQEHLAKVLRECDGGKLQCILMIRDDFLTPITRFMDLLQIPLAGNPAIAMVDLFRKRHAKKVLALLGQGYRQLPPLLEGEKFSREQNRFLNQAISELAEGDRVIPVRLALSAQMFKDKEWTTAILKAVGGATGIGVAFLEDSLAAETAPKAHRRHQQAAQQVLRALLPEPGATIKGAMRQKRELQELSGYSGRPEEFDQLLEILDRELRLVTPTETEFESGHGQPPEQRYQLTHDYLVPSLREWLTLKQKETPEGRAELLLEESVALWSTATVKPLPTWPQWVEIHSLTMQAQWTESQQKMMAAANERHLNAVRDRLLSASIVDVPTVLREIEQCQSWVGNGLLQEVFSESASSHDPRKQLHASLALLLVEESGVDFLCDRMLTADLLEVSVILESLKPHKDALLDKLWSVAGATARVTGSQRLRAAAALAKFDPKRRKWTKIAPVVVADLVLENPIFLGQWSELLRPVKSNLLSPLSEVFRERNAERSAERTLATNLLVDYAADNPELLADLLMDADDRQFAILYPKFKEHGEQGLPSLTQEVTTLPSPDASLEAREKLAKRTANAAVALLRMNQPVTVWPRLRHSDDPRTRSYLIHRLSPLGADAAAIIRHLEVEPDISIRRALLLSLGEYTVEQLSPAVRTSLLPRLQEIYCADPDPGLHAAVEWLLRRWDQDEWMDHRKDEWVAHREVREQQVRQSVARDPQHASRQWYVNSQRQTMVVIPGPVEFTMGSPISEVGRDDDEPQHQRRIERSFAVAAHSVTLEQYRQFESDYQLPEAYTRVANLPVVGINWYRAAKYCNWLSEQEGVPQQEWCYEIVSDDVSLKANYLSLSGYRLPTEAEMENVTRAEATTSRYFGETDELLPKYAWFNKNSQEKIWPVGRLKPNDFGLFDVQGNVNTWCQERCVEYPQEETANDTEDDRLVIIGKDLRVLRGGSFNDGAAVVRSAVRFTYLPDNRSNIVGFRVSRTLLPVPFTPLPTTPEGGQNFFDEQQSAVQRQKPGDSQSDVVADDHDGAVIDHDQNRRSEFRVGGIPRSGRILFVTRCIKRTTVSFDCLPTIGGAITKFVANTVARLEAMKSVPSTSGWPSRAKFQRANEACLQAKKAALQQLELELTVEIQAVIRFLAALEHAVGTAAAADPRTSVRFAELAAEESRISDAHGKAQQADLEILHRATESRGWDEDSPISPDILGPLWP